MKDQTFKIIWGGGIFFLLALTVFFSCSKENEILPAGQNETKISYDSADCYLDGVLVPKNDPDFHNAEHMVFTEDSTRIDAFSSDEAFEIWIAISGSEDVGNHWILLQKVQAYYDYLDYENIISIENDSLETLLSVIPPDSLDAWGIEEPEIVYDEDEIPKTTGWHGVYDNYNLGAPFLFGFKGFVPTLNNSRNDKNNSHRSTGAPAIAAFCQHKNFKGKKKWFVAAGSVWWNHFGFENSTSSCI